ncbi:hypothetical protein BJX61DRAFT_203731 [Aspergillus egyptiacus]|nr:hypothetical protein BJX61DRAFT_203731 [Aspergillus egyptiacus]
MDTPVGLPPIPEEEQPSSVKVSHSVGASCSIEAPSVVAARSSDAPPSPSTTDNAFSSSLAHVFVNHYMEHMRRHQPPLEKEKEDEDEHGTEEKDKDDFEIVEDCPVVSHELPIRLKIADSDAPVIQEKLEDAITTLLSTTENGSNKQDADAMEDTIGDDDGELVQVPPQRPPSRESTLSTEPFPAYEPCELEAPSPEYNAQALAYDHMLSSLAAELNRFRPIGEALTILHGPMGFAVNEARAPGQPYIFSMENIPRCPEVSHHDHYCVEHDQKKINARAEIRSLLYPKGDRFDSLRNRFAMMANMVMAMEWMFFREKYFPSRPMDYITETDLRQVQDDGIHMVTFLSRLGLHTYQSLDTARRSFAFVAEVASEPEISVVVRFQRMAEIVIQ